MQASLSPSGDRHARDLGYEIGTGISKQEDPEDSKTTPHSEMRGNVHGEARVTSQLHCASFYIVHCDSL